MNNYYQILELDQNASQDEIKKAYRRLALKWHPDKNHSPKSHEKFIEINEAYLVLSDPLKRKAFDQIFGFSHQDPTSNNENEFDYSNFEEHLKSAREKANEYANFSFHEFSKTLSKSLGKAGKVVAKSTLRGIFYYLLAGVILFLGKLIFSETRSVISNIPSEERLVFSDSLIRVTYTDMEAVRKNQENSIQTAAATGLIKINQDSVIVLIFTINGMNVPKEESLFSKIRSVKKSKNSKNYTIYDFKTNNGDISVIVKPNGSPYHVGAFPYSFTPKNN